MNLTRYVTDLRNHLDVAAHSGGDDARDVAERLTAPLESAARLVLLEALSDAAAEITRDLAPGAVELRLRGLDPEFVVTLVEPSAGFADDDAARGSAAASSAPLEEDGGTTRTTLRLPDNLKGRIEQAAAQEGLSVNSWLVRAVSGALDTSRRPSQRPRGGDRFTGWVR
jgi:hypothetical protein